MKLSNSSMLKKNVANSSVQFGSHIEEDEIEYRASVRTRIANLCKRGRLPLIDDVR